MTGLRIIGCITALLSIAAPASASDIIDSVTSALRDQGYARITVSTTLLGRTRIEAKGEDVQREIVLDRRTGEVLRDYWRPIDDSRADQFTAPIIDHGNSSKTDDKDNAGNESDGSSGEDEADDGPEDDDGGPDDEHDDDVDDGE